jgi:hypothetical protein
VNLKWKPTSGAGTVSHVDESLVLTGFNLRTVHKKAFVKKSYFK